MRWLRLCSRLGLCAVAKSSKKRGVSTRGVKRVSADRATIGQMNHVVLDAIRKAQ